MSLFRQPNEPKEPNKPKELFSPSDPRILDPSDPNLEIMPLCAHPSVFPMPFPESHPGIVERQSAFPESGGF
jgi:hypothetical protein